jgi:hypothetical protein
MTLNFKKLNFVMAYLIFTIMICLMMHEFTISTAITNFFATVVIFVMAGHMQSDPMMALMNPLFKIGKYVVFFTMAICLGIMTLIGWYPMSLIQYLAFVVTLPAFYYLVESAFAEPA